MDHMLWECPEYAEIRSLPRYHAVAVKNPQWPRCLTNYGIVPLSCDPLPCITDLHHMMVSIVQHRDDLDRATHDISSMVPVWDLVLHQPLLPHVWDGSSLPDMPPQWPYSKLLLRSMLSWLQALQWTTQGSVSYCELAIDYEVYSGIDLSADTPPLSRSQLSLRERGKLLGKLLKTLNRVCAAAGLSPPVPASVVTRLYCLRPLGVKEVWGGLTPRPIFACHEETVSILTQQLTKLNPYTKRSGWGLELIPDYSSLSQRQHRSLAWSTAPLELSSQTTTQDSPPLSPRTPISRKRGRDPASSPAIRRRRRRSRDRSLVAAGSYRRCPGSLRRPLQRSSSSSKRVLSYSPSALLSPEPAKRPKASPNLSPVRLKFEEATGPRSRVVK